jgi:excisionase family DNA binding protein
MNTHPDLQIVRFNTTDQARSSEPLLLRVSEVARLLQLSRDKVYELANTPPELGVLPVVRIGKSIRVPRKALERWLETQ